MNAILILLFALICFAVEAAVTKHKHSEKHK